jgi:hypothetical protein
LENEVCVLGEELGLGDGNTTCLPGTKAHENRNQGHEDGESNGRQKTRDDTKNDLRDILDPSKTRKSLDRVNLSNDTNDGDGNSPEDNENSNDGVDDISANDNLPPGEVQALPDNVIRLDTDETRSHVEGMVVSGSLESSLGIRLGVELDEHGRVLLIVASEPVSLSIVGLGDEGLQLLAAPFNSINLLANKPQRASTV